MESADVVVLCCNSVWTRRQIPTFRRNLSVFRHVLTSSFFCFTGQFYKQTAGVAMGSLLSLVIANSFLEDFEEHALKGTAHKPLC
jgi:hypothetical protein